MLMQLAHESAADKTFRVEVGNEPWKAPEQLFTSIERVPEEMILCNGI